MSTHQTLVFFVKNERNYYIFFISNIYSALSSDKQKTILLSFIFIICEAFLIPHILQNSHLVSCELYKMIVVVNNLRKFKIEFTLLSVFFGWYLSSNIIINQMLKQTCLHTFNLGINVCNELETSTLVEEILQPYVARIMMTTSIFNAIFPGILCLCIAQWSDKFGRKKMLNCICCGLTISMASITIISFYSDYISVNSPWNYFIAQLPFIFFGGWPTLLTLVLCYLTDQTTVENRSYRFTIVELIIFFSVLVAIASSSFILKITNVTIVFAISFSCILMGTIIEIFLVEESVKDVKQGVKLQDKIYELFSIQHIKEIFVSFMMKRDFNKRKILWSLMTILLILNFAQHGSTPLLYLFVRQKFSWTLQDVTIFSSSEMAMTMIGTIFALFFLKRSLKYNDLKISTFGMSSALISVIFTTFAFTSWQMYLAAFIGCLRITTFPMLRSLMSTVVNENEVSKIYSLTSSIEAMSGLGAAPLYTAVYSSTLSTFPSAFYLITAGLYMISVSLALFIAKWMKNNNAKNIKTTVL